jgi:hypothetical protein
VALVFFHAPGLLHIWVFRFMVRYVWFGVYIFCPRLVLVLLLARCCVLKLMPWRSRLDDELLADGASLGINVSLGPL